MSRQDAGTLKYVRWVVFFTYVNCGAPHAAAAPRPPHPSITAKSAVATRAMLTWASSHVDSSLVRPVCGQRHMPSKADGFHLDDPCQSRRRTGVTSTRP